MRGRKKWPPTRSSPCKSRTFQNAGNLLGDFKGVQVQLHFIWGVNWGTLGEVAWVERVRVDTVVMNLGLCSWEPSCWQVGCFLKGGDRAVSPTRCRKQGREIAAIKKNHFRVGFYFSLPLKIKVYNNFKKWVGGDLQPRSTSKSCCVLEIAILWVSYDLIELEAKKWLLSNIWLRYHLDFCGQVSSDGHWESSEGEGDP